MRFLLVLAALALAAPFALAQDAPADTSDVLDGPVETPPVLIGGLDGLMERLEYPEMARRAGIEGRVFVQFIVDEEGRVSQAECRQLTDQPPPNALLCEAAIDAVMASRFTPGTQGGHAVKVRYTLPVGFKLTGGRCI